MSGSSQFNSVIEEEQRHSEAIADVGSDPWQLPEAYTTPCWYAVYTRPRHEKLVASQCGQRSVECFLPLYTARRSWGHRQAVVELPLFPTYLFVHIGLRDRLLVQTIPGVVSFVTVSGRPAFLEESELQALQNAVRHRNTEPHPYLMKGKKVRVTSGALAGLEGVVVRRKDQVRVIVSIPWMSRSVAVQLEAADLEVLK